MDEVAGLIRIGFDYQSLKKIQRDIGKLMFDQVSLSEILN